MPKVSRKGQVTIPANVREALSIHPGDRVLFELEQDGAHLRVVKSTPLTGLFGALSTDRPTRTTSSQEEAVGTYLGDLDRRTHIDRS